MARANDWMMVAGVALVGALGYFALKSSSSSSSPASPASTAPGESAVPEGAEVTFADGTKATMFEDTPIATLENEGAVSYLFNGTTFFFTGGNEIHPLGALNS